MRRLTPVSAYVCAVATAALVCVIWATGGARAGETSWLMLIVFTAGIVTAEFMPVTFGRRQKSVALAFSGAFSFALVLIAPLGIAILVQALAGIAEDLQARSGPLKLVFNCSVYALAFCATRAVFDLLSEGDVLTTGLSVRQVVAFVAAALAYFLVNHILLSVVTALASGRRVFSAVVEGGALIFLPQVDVVVAPLTIAAFRYSPWFVPLIMMPVLVMHQSARLASLREHEATHDVLTGLPNRTLLSVQFDEVAETFDRDGAAAAVLMVDLDHFKEINDTLGHHAGDLLLQEVAERLRSVVGEPDMVARLGGDEFAVLVRVSADSPGVDAANLAARLIAALADPFEATGVRLDVQGTVGIALAPRHGRTLGELLSYADVALYVAKEDRGSFRIYSPEQNEHAPERLSLLGQLREGIERDELVLHYQPKIDSPSGEVVGVEALVRWRHPDRGLLGPGEFVPLAESTGLIVPMTYVVLDAALAQLRRWLDRGWDLSMSVNLSVRHLTDEALPERVAEALHRHDVPAHRVILEVTESTIMNDSARSAAIVGRIRALGVSIAIDDYGTGYSSLTYLRRLQVDELKIDREFVMAMAGPDTDDVIVRSTIELGHRLGLRVVAEGVEDAATLAALTALGCDEIQGFYISRPLPVVDLDPWLASRSVRSGTVPTAREGAMSW